jgi:protein-arginine kinase activator protein McsA
MKAAAAGEDYELAARLRDQIRQKEAEGTNG